MAESARSCEDLKSMMEESKKELEEFKSEMASRRKQMEESDKVHKETLAQHGERMA